MHAMSSDRANNRTLKPSLAPNRVARSPLTPRVAGAGATVPLTKPIAQRLSARTPVASPRVKPQDEKPTSNGIGSANVTPRSAARLSRVENVQNLPSLETPPSGGRPRSMFLVSDTPAVRGATIGHVRTQSNSRASRPTSVVGDSATPRLPHTPLPRSPGFVDLGIQSTDESVDSRFFHASDAQKQDLSVKKAEPKKTPAFFYADGQEDTSIGQSNARGGSPTLSAMAEKRSSGTWARSDTQSDLTRSPPLLSPQLNTLTGTSPYFAAATPPQQYARSPSPTKENIHLSYRKGASQIFGTRASPRPTTTSIVDDHNHSLNTAQRRPSFGPHRKSMSISSIDSGNSHHSWGRSNTVHEGITTTSPLSHEFKAPPVPKVSSPSARLPSIDTSLESPTRINSPPEGTLSPVKAVSELAADARRERKVLDLEISNSSLLAINASLEREVRRQKTELKRFRRLSRAGHLSTMPYERSARLSEGLSTLGEEDGEDMDFDGFGPPSGLTDLYDMSDSEDESSLGSTSGSMSPGARAAREQDRLAKDEKRLRVDLEKHKELLVQSQMMNQSLKRCMYATEEMIREANKALQYHVRVSDVKLGGRILTGNDDEDNESREISLIDDSWTGPDDSVENAKGVLDVWSSIGKGKVEGSEYSADRDSGIEIDKMSLHTANGSAPTSQPTVNQGRPSDAGQENMARNLAILDEMEAEAKTLEHNNPRDS